MNGGIAAPFLAVSYALPTEVASAIKDACAGVGTSVMSTIGDVIPYALVIFGGVLGITIALKFFGKLAQSN